VRSAGTSIRRMRRLRLAGCRRASAPSAAYAARSSMRPASRGHSRCLITAQPARATSASSMTIPDERGEEGLRRLARLPWSSGWRISPRYTPGVSSGATIGYTAEEAPQPEAPPVPHEKRRHRRWQSVHMHSSRTPTKSGAGSGPTSFAEDGQRHAHVGRMSRCLPSSGASCAHRPSRLGRADVRSV